MNSVMFAVALAEARPAVRAADGLEAKLRAAMRVTRNHWMCTDENEQFKAAIGAVMEEYGQGSPEWDRLVWEVRQLGKISAMQQAALAGLSVDIASLDFEIGVHEPVGLLGMWKGERG